MGNILYNYLACIKIIMQKFSVPIELTRWCISLQKIYDFCLIYKKLLIRVTSLCHQWEVFSEWKCKVQISEYWKVMFCYFCLTTHCLLLLSHLRDFSISITRVPSFSFEVIPLGGTTKMIFWDIFLSLSAVLWNLTWEWVSENEEKNTTHKI